MTPSPTRLLPPKAEQLFQPSLPWAHLSPSQAPLLPPRSSAPLGQALLRAADRAAALASTACSAWNGFKQPRMCPYSHGSQGAPWQGMWRWRWQVQCTLDTWASSLPAPEGAEPRARASFPSPKSGTASQQLRKEVRSQIPAWERESRPVLWKVVTSSGEEFKLFARIRNSPVCCGSAPSRLVPSPAGKLTHTHPLRCWRPSQRQLRGRDLCCNFELTSVLWPLCSAQKVGQ